MATPDHGQPEKFAHSVRNLTRLSSEGDYVVVDREAPCILQSATRIKKSQSPYGVFYEAYHSTKSKAKSFFSGPPRAQSRHCSRSIGLYVQVAVPQSTDPYDTTNWDDEQTDRKHYIAANNVARYGTIHSAVSRDFPSISGHLYVLNKFKIYQTYDESDNPVRDYFLQIRVDAPGIKYIFVHAKESGEIGCPHIQYIRDLHYPHAVAQ